MNTPTKKQTALLEFIGEFTEKNGYCPSYREIMHAMHLKSVSAVAEHIENCVVAGFLRKVPKSARSLEVIKPRTYEETVGLFQEKIVSLTEANPDNPKIATLVEAAKILGIEL
ncbi:hypothetical protein FWF89_01710 [Candidatus Saccharibacteria bacterium]|nr:hypothetical protein [Candidatus Saccharibacteria bacterium]